MRIPDVGARPLKRAGLLAVAAFVVAAMAGDRFTHRFGDERVARLWPAVRGTDSRLAEVLRRYGPTARYNEQRHAVQVSCGAGIVIESVPLTGAQIATVEAPSSGER